jgi:hypothetical protein
MIQFSSVAGSSTELPNEEPTTHDAFDIDIFVIVGAFRDDPNGLSGTCPIPQGDYQQHRDETGADPQGDIYNGLTNRRGWVGKR